jgi:hypothetical protein
MMADAVTWQFSVPREEKALGRNRHYDDHDVRAITPQAALNLAQAKIDSTYGPGRWSASQAVVLTTGPNRIIVERVGHGDG